MIVGWKSPLDGRVYDLDDFEALNRVIPEPVLRAMSKRARLDTRHTGTNITITSGLTCPRKTLVHRMFDITPDPTKMWKMQRGSWLHELIGLSLGENDAWWTEETANEKCEYAGSLFDIPMSCKVDALRKDYGELVDWKFRADGAERWIDPQGRAREEDAAQLNMSRLLIEQNLNRELSDMRLYVWVMAGKTVRTEAAHMSEEQIGMVRPGGADYSTKEIFGMLHIAMSGWESLASSHDGNIFAVPKEKRQELVAALPMVGEKMYAKARTPQINACTMYCEVQDECYGCSGGM